MTSVAELLPKTKKLAFDLQSQVRQVSVDLIGENVGWVHMSLLPLHTSLSTQNPNPIGRWRWATSPRTTSSWGSRN